MARLNKASYIIPTIAGIAFFVFVIWIIHEANIGRDNFLFKTVRATPFGDKIGHLFLAGFLTLVIIFLLQNRVLHFRKGSTDPHRFLDRIRLGGYRGG